jgi:uncharacterized repeat protein (TIGR03803 family)
LYGTALSAGDYANGMVFALNTDGSGFTNLHSFTALPFYQSGTNTDGAYPYSELVLSGGTLYGTASFGGAFGFGTIFGLNTNGAGFTNLHSFTGTSDGANPYAGLVLSNGRLFGTTSSGGSSGDGTIFAINTDGSGFTNLYNFTALESTSGTNADGANPRAQLVLAGNVLFGTAPSGGTSGFGTAFSIHVDGTGFTNLHSFTAIDPITQTNTDGANPFAGLSLIGPTLYGAAYAGGSFGSGSLFCLNTNGAGFTNFYNFAAQNSPCQYCYTTNSDGGNPYAALIQFGSVMYGTAVNGGSSGYGTVFAIGTNGVGFTDLHDFMGDDGIEPMAGLALAGSTVYGTTRAGGNSYYGTVFALHLVPPLSIASVSKQVLVSWPTWAPNNGLQTTTNLSSGIWSDITNAANVVGANYVFTNTTGSKAAFFRLKGQ